MSFADQVINDCVVVVQGDLDNVASKFERVMKSECKAKRISQAITKEKLSDTEYLVGVDGDETRTSNGDDFSVYYWRGTNPHRIVPRNKKALKWDNGAVHFAKRVHHPGTKPHPFVERACARFK